MKQLFATAAFPRKKQLFRGRRRIIISWHRFYDPETGRYISADPIGLAGGMNLYAYTDNDPVNFIDPLGLFSNNGMPKCGYEWVGGLWKDYTENTRTQTGTFTQKVRIWHEYPFVKPKNNPSDFFNIYKILTYEYQYKEAEYSLMQARQWACYDECGNETYRGWAPSASTGTYWEMIEGSKMITSRRFLPRFEIEFGPGWF